MPERERIIFHIDVNSAYLSWTALEQLKNGSSTDLRTVPSIIGGDEKSRHGVVLAKSIPAKKYGIQTGEPVAAALRKCPGLVMASPDHRLYREYSRAMIRLLTEEFSPELEQVSIDECYMDFTSQARFYASPEEAAGRIRDRIFMVGGRSASKLKSLGVLTIGDLARSDPAFLNAHFKSHGTLMWEYANGIDPSPVVTKRQEAKGVGNSTTLSEDVTEAGRAHEILLELSESVSRRLKKAGQLAGTVTVEIKYYDFTKSSHQTQALSPVNSAGDICRLACSLFDELWDGRPVRLLGVRSSKLTAEGEPVQLSIFDLPEAVPVKTPAPVETPDPGEAPAALSKKTAQKREDASTAPSPEKLKKLDAAMEAIRRRYGENAIHKGAPGSSRDS